MRWHIDYETLFFQGPDLLEKAGGLHKFMNWNRALLTVSMVTPIKFLFKLPNDYLECFL